MHTHALVYMCCVIVYKRRALQSHTYDINTFFVKLYIDAKILFNACIYIASSFIIDGFFFWPCIYNQSSVQIVTLLID